MRTHIYIDGFNLYYGALRATPYKWLNPRRMCELLLPGHDLAEVKYFTARISARPQDPNQPARQQAYLRGLETLPDTKIIYGHFLTKEVHMPLAGCPPDEQEYAKVLKTEEKGSDVNMATHLLRDAFRREAEAFVLVTNDSDLLEAVRIVTEELGLPVGVLNPHKKPSRVLLKAASFFKPIRKGVLEASQFPASIQDSHGTITKPDRW